MSHTFDDEIRSAMQKSSKSAAEYTPQGTMAEHCGICQHFLSPHSCERVKGRVASGGWCRFFKRRRGK